MQKKSAPMQKTKISAGHTDKQNKKTEKPDFILDKFDRSGEVAMYYGFISIKSPIITKEDISHANKIVDVSEKTAHRSSLFPSCAEKLSLLRTYSEWQWSSLPHPVMIYYKKNHPVTSHKKQDFVYCNLDILGTTNSVAEALTLKTAIAILNTEGYNNLSVEINTMGDKESLSRAEHEISHYFRKNINNLPAEYRQLYKKDVFEILRCDNEKCRPFFDQAPKTLNFLSEQSSQHFKEVLEYLEEFAIPYRINNGLVGDKNYCTHTIFEIKNADSKDDDILAIGTRHNQLSKKIGFKKDMPLMSVSLTYKKLLPPKKITLKSFPKTRFYFIQLGFQAKLKSLQIIETLRKIKVPISHALAKDKFTPQLSVAENQKYPYMIIMGMKEAVENTVVVRNTTTRAQDTVSMATLPEYIKSLKV